MLASKTALHFPAIRLRAVFCSQLLHILALTLPPNLPCSYPRTHPTTPPTLAPHIMTADHLAPPSSGSCTDLSINDAVQNPDMDSPNAMAIDSDDTHIIQPNGLPEKDHVTEITPETLSGDAEQLHDLPLANDCTS